MNEQSLMQQKDWPTALNRPFQDLAHYPIYLIGTCTLQNLNILVYLKKLAPPPEHEGEGLYFVPVVLFSVHSEKEVQGRRLINGDEQLGQLGLSALEVRFEEENESLHSEIKALFYSINTLYVFTRNQIYKVSEQGLLDFLIALQAFRRVLFYKLFGHVPCEHEDLHVVLHRHFTSRTKWVQTVLLQSIIITVSAILTAQRLRPSFLFYFFFYASINSKITLEKSETYISLARTLAPDLDLIKKQSDWLVELERARTSIFQSLRVNGRK